MKNENFENRSIKIKKQIDKSLNKSLKIIEEFQKKTIKTQRGILKDIEITKTKFTALYLLIISLGSIVISNIRLGISIIGNWQILGISAILFGALLGLLVGTILIDVYSNRYTPLMICLSLTGVSIILERLIFKNLELQIISGSITLLNSAIFGFVGIYLFVLFIEFTNILERGRIFAFLILTAGFTILIFIVLAYLETLLIIPSIIPIITLYYIYKNRDLKLKLKKIHKSNKLNLKNIKIDFYIIKNIPFLLNIFMLFVFGIMNGLLIPIEKATAIATNELFQRYFFIVLIISLFILGVMTLVIGYIFDFLGRKIVVSVFILGIGIINFIKPLLQFQGIISETPTAIASLSLIIELIILIPLITGELIKPEKYGIGILYSIIFGIGGFIFGIGLQFFVESTVGIHQLISLFCIFVLFFLVHTKETISRLELEWPEALYHLYIIHESGLLIYDYSFKEEELVASDLVSGGIIGLVTMLKEITKTKDRLKVIDHGDKKIIFQWSETGNVIFVLISKYELIVLRNKLNAFIKEFEEYFGSEKMELKAGVNLEDWKDTKIFVEKYFCRKIFTEQIVNKLLDKKIKK